MLLGVLAELIVPQVGEELPDRKCAGDLAMLFADLLAKVSLLLLEVFGIAAQRPHRPAWQATLFPGDLLADLVERLAAELHDMEAVKQSCASGKCPAAPAINALDMSMAISWISATLGHPVFPVRPQTR